ncbi:hypothetical protein BOTBODRAFT_35458 [Botryobasidium botryosum FD-172 SS1]|uniref:Uncharacterized protein n=1 Tax=Botryobasidium botryosum (strain FD-172 SS1) TaxID=930990 RepID=A0A067M9M4_BOTB1|nr:hypothetical protein BOTBODRAFT_35458 [Botryobasidium botryosum FD-172 SS1]
MSNRISITTSREDQLRAAPFLSQTLRELGAPHAYIGGFAWALLGSTRPTEDIDVLIQIRDKDVQQLRKLLAEHSKHFAELGLKLFYVKELQGDLTGDQLVRASKGNTMIETLQAGTLGLPSVAGPVYEYQAESGIVLELLHPGVLILTKMKRWWVNRDSTRPKTVAKRLSDQRDLRYLVRWLTDNGMTIEFEQYQGKSKEELMQYVRTLRDVFSEDTDFVQTLRQAVKPADWDLL